MKSPRSYRVRWLRIAPLAFLWIVAQSAIGGYMHGASVGQLVANHLPMGSVFFLLLLVFVVNPILSRFGRDVALSTAELTVVWGMTTAASAVPGYGLMEFLFPYIAAPLYFATPENQWQEVVLPQLKEWLYLSDPAAVRAFFEGIEPGDSIPWEPWLKPAGFAVALGMCLFFALGCWAVVIRRQWIERERYAFPLVHVAYHVTQTDPTGRPLNSTFRAPTFWIAAGAMIVVHTLRGLHGLIPAVPTVPIDFPITRLFPNPPWNALAQAWPLWPHLYFSVVGVTYFLHLDVSLSLWFFFTQYKFQQVFFRAFSVTSVNTQHQVMGAVVVLALFSVWQARRHLADVFRKALNPLEPTVDDSDEPTAYRAAVVGMTLGFAALAGLCVLMGMSLWMVVCFIIMLWILATATAWHVSNAGLLLVNIGFSPFSFFVNLLGSRTVGARNLVLLGFDRSSIPHWTAESLMPYVLQSFRLTDMHHLPARSLRLPRWMSVSVLLAVIVAFASSMHWIHWEGALNFEPWVYRGVGPGTVRSAGRMILNPVPPSVPGITSAAVGGAAMAFLVFMRQRFLWWPFHPLGYALGVTWAPFHLWFSTLVGWALKLSILRFGGFGLYRRLRPLFIGLILGEYFMVAVWSLIGLKTGIAYWGLPH